MNNLPPSVLIILGIIVVVGLRVYSNYNFKGKLVALWTPFAQRSGILIERGNFFQSPQMKGSFRNHPVVIHVYSEQIAKMKIRYTQFIMPVSNSAGAKFRLLTATTSLGKLSTAMGFGTKLGIEEFDKRFEINCTPSEYASLLLAEDRNIQETLTRNSTKWFRLTLQDGNLILDRKDIEVDSRVLENLLNMLCDVAEKIEAINHKVPAYR